MIMMIIDVPTLQKVYVLEHVENQSWLKWVLKAGPYLLVTSNLYYNVSPLHCMSIIKGGGHDKVIVN